MRATCWRPQLLNDAYRTDVRPLWRRCAPSGNAAEDPIAALRAGGYSSARSPRAAATSRWPGGGAGDGRHPDRASHRGPLAGGRAGGALEQLVLRSNLLGADRAVANFGGGNTSVKTREVDHAGREIDGALGQGLGQRPGDDGRRGLHGPAPAGDPAALRARRDERRGDGRLPRPLPARAVDAALLDRDAAARIRPGAARRPHPSRRDQRDRRRGRRRGARARCFGDEVAWIDYIRPGFTLARQVGEAIRADDRLRIVILAKHGLVTWGDSARRATARRSTRSTAPPTSSTSARTAAPRFGGPRTAPLLDDQRREELLGRLLPALRGAVGSERPRCFTSTRRPPVLELLDSERGAPTS